MPRLTALGRSVADRVVLGLSAPYPVGVAQRVADELID